MSRIDTVRLAGILARRADFRAWIEHISIPAQSISTDEAAQFIRAVCKIGSRRELATDAAAEQRFHQHVRRPFTAWRENEDRRTKCPL